MAQFDNVSVFKAANVYFDGRCVSHTLVFSDGAKKTLGVILPSSLEFTTGEPERMECVLGACRYRLKGDVWKDCSAGQSFSVPGNSSFEISCDEPFHYVCHIG